jgi:ubiquinone/menaquinone biosynthesis C-methylase UbiE
MNRLENWFCATSFWRNMTQREVLPWLLRDVELGEHVLELGAGPGAGTEELRKRAARVTSLEYSHDFAAELARRSGGSENGAVVQGDASTLPFPEKTFSAAIAVLMLHHLKSPETQERALRETFRVLRSGGKFIALDIPDGWLHRVIHIRSTFVPFAPETAPARLAAAGFSGVQLAIRSGAFRWHAERPR